MLTVKMEPALNSNGVVALVIIIKISCLNDLF